MKRCSACKEIKENLAFGKNKNTKDKLAQECTLCRKTYYCKTQKMQLAKKREYVKNNKEKTKVALRNNYQKNKEVRKQNQKEYYQKNREHILAEKKKYIVTHKEHKNIWARQRHQLKKSDPSYIIPKRLRNRMNAILKNSPHKVSAIKFLGCSIEEFKKHIEKQFQEGMTWDNYSFKGWHLDHIIPLSTIDLTNKDEIKKVVHYTNIQPLWAKDNLSKGNKLIGNTIHD